VEWSNSDDRVLIRYSYLYVGRRGTPVKVSCGKLDKMLQEISGWFPQENHPQVAEWLVVSFVSQVPVLYRSG